MADPTPELKGLLDKIAEGEKNILALLDQQKSATASERDALNEKIASADKSLTGVRDELKAATDKFEAQGKDLGEAKARIDDIEKRLGRPGFGGDVKPEAKSLGTQFVEMLQKSGSIDRMRTGRGDSDSLMIDRAVAEIMAASRPEQKATLALSDTTNFAPVMRDAMLLPNQRRLVIRNLMNTVRTTQNAVEYVEILGFGPETQSGTVTSITESSGVGTVTTGAAHGLQIGDRLQVSGANEAAYNTVHFVHTVPSTTTLTIKIASGTGDATGTLVWRTMRGGAAAGVSENSGKPEARMKVATRTANVQVIAHWLPATRQVLDDVSQIRGIIDNELLYGLDNKLESALLYGTGSSPELQGILTLGARQTYDGSLDTYSLDAIRKGVTRVEMAEAEPTLCLVNPLDWERMEITKSSSDEHYVLAGGAAGSARTLWRVPILATPRIAAGTALIGDFSMGATIYDRESANIRFSEHHSTYFTSNLLAILAEMRVGVAWKRPESFCSITLPAAV